ncbi:MAG: hypothetical protein OSB00_06065 [Sphingomonas bacterium]|nr:hypothetical protein [Sphingomonas bacterium]
MSPLFLTDTTQITDAAQLIATFGSGAGGEAAARAGKSAVIGNHITYCRWRQVERLIDVLTATEAPGTVH